MKQEVYLEYRDGTKALNDVNLQIKRGNRLYYWTQWIRKNQFAAFMGIEQPTSGKLSVLGKEINKEHKRNIREIRRQIGPVFQEFKLIPGRTAIDNVILGMRVLGMPRVLLNKNALEALEKVGLTHKAFSKVDNLSWGERQRVAIARAVARKPALILADEPTGNLDIKNALRIMELYVL